MELIYSESTYDDCHEIRHPLTGNNFPSYNQETEVLTIPMIVGRDDFTLEFNYLYIKVISDRNAIAGKLLVNDSPKDSVLPMESQCRLISTSDTLHEYVMKSLLAYENRINWFIESLYKSTLSTDDMKLIKKSINTIRFNISLQLEAVLNHYQCCYKKIHIYSINEFTNHLIKISTSTIEYIKEALS